MAGRLGRWVIVSVSWYDLPGYKLVVSSADPVRIG
jgi:hypothetical protein